MPSKITMVQIQIQCKLIFYLHDSQKSCLYGPSSNLSIDRKQRFVIHKVIRHMETQIVKKAKLIICLHIMNSKTNMFCPLHRNFQSTIMLSLVADII